MAEALSIKAASLDAPAKSLSGGNQQKVVLAKWLMSEPSIFIMDEPTRGIDVGAKYEIYAIIDRLAADAGGVLFISSELEELLAISDRILVMSQGEIVGEFARAEFDREADPRGRLPRAGGRGMNRTPARPADRLLLRNATAIIFIVVFVYFGLSAANFFSTENTLNIIKQASFVGVIAVGMTFVLLTAGIDLSVGSNMYVSAMTVGYLLQLPGLQGGFGVFAGIVVGLATGAAFGAVNAFCVVFLRITPFLVTLATMVAGHGLVTAITESLRHRLPRGLHRLRRRVGPRRADPDRHLRDRGGVGACRADPHGHSAVSSMPSATTSRRRGRPASTPTASSSPSTSSPGSARRSAALR